MPAWFEEHPDRYVLANDDGTFTVWKAITWNENGFVVGPGYVGRAILRNNGDYVTEGFVGSATSANDPRIQGLMYPAWHHYRNIPGEPNIWNKGWEMKGTLDAAQHGGDFGVSSMDVVVAPFTHSNGTVRASFVVNFVDPFARAEGKRIMAVRYDYIVAASELKCWVTFTAFPDGADAGPAPFLKEPKIVFGIAPNRVDGYRPDTFHLFDAAGALLHTADIPSDPRLQDPTQSTLQLPYDGRARARFYDGVNYFNIVGRASDVLEYGAGGGPSNYKASSRGPWESASGPGHDAWARAANGRAEFDPSVCAAYCKQGGAGASSDSLTRKWEMVKRSGEPQTSLMMHSWEGGSGLPDCLCCAKAFVPGEAYTAFVSLSRDAGWTL